MRVVARPIGAIGYPRGRLYLLSAKDQEYFSDGVTEDIITDLSKISGLFVVARNSTFTYKGRAEKVRPVAQELGVRYVLEGSVRRTGDKIRITTQVVDALKDHHIWAERYDRELKDVFAVQSEAARQVARTLAVTLKANESERRFQKYTANVDAYDTFLQARRTVDQPSQANIERGGQLFEKVIELGPMFAGGYAGLSFNYSVKVRFQYGDSAESFLAKSFELARKAVELDGGFVWGHIALGGAYLAAGDARGAVAAVSKALASNPVATKRISSWGGTCNSPGTRPAASNTCSSPGVSARSIRTATWRSWPRRNS